MRTSTMPRNWTCLVGKNCMSAANIIFSKSLSQALNRIHRSKSGASELILSRPDLYDLLLREIPPEKIHMGKRVL